MRSIEKETGWLLMGERMIGFEVPLSWLVGPLSFTLSLPLELNLLRHSTRLEVIGPSLISLLLRLTKNELSKECTNLTINYLRSASIIKWSLILMTKNILIRSAEFLCEVITKLLIDTNSLAWELSMRYKRLLFNRICCILMMIGKSFNVCLTCRLDFLAALHFMKVVLLRQ